MLKVGITGIDGLLGWHLRAFLHHMPEVSIVMANRATFASRNALADFVASSDVIVHFAGMNRGDEKQVAETNIALTDDLLAACERSSSKPHIIFSSSTQIYRNTAYGDSKQKCTERFKSWAARTGALFTNLILPNVFGEGGKPFYNSVVSTFCFQLANAQQPKILNDIRTEQVHAQSVARLVYDCIVECKTGNIQPSGTLLTVTELLNKLKSFSDQYENAIIPAIQNDFDLCLFNTYRSYLFPQKYPMTPILHMDERGALFEAVKSLNSGQTFISTTKTGITRGNHYHAKKFERFCVVGGQAEIRIRKVFTDNTSTFLVNGHSPQFIDMPTFHTHNITNTGPHDLITLFWSHEIFNPLEPDTFHEVV